MVITLFTITETLFVFIIGIIIAMVPYMTEKSVIFGVRIPLEYINSNTVNKMKKTYLFIVLILTAIFTVITLITPYIFIISLMPLFIIIVEFMVYLPEHYRLKKIKSSEHWIMNGNVNENKITGIFNTEKAKFPWFFGIPGILITISIFITGLLYYKNIPHKFATHFNANGVPNAYSIKSIGSVFILGFISIVTTAMIILLAYAIYKTSLKTDNASSNGEKKAMLFRERMVYTVLLIPAFINSTLLISSFQMWGILKKNILVDLIPIFLMVVLVLVVSFKTGQLGSNIKIDNDNKVSNNSDDDSLWKAGVLYYNKNDTRMMVPKRFGVGYTINFGRPVGLVIFILLISIPVIVVIITFISAGII